MCYEASVVWHSWQQHKLFHISLPNHILVSCRPGPLQSPTGKNHMGSTTLCQHCSHILSGTVPCKMDQKRITIHHMACQITRPNTTWFFFCEGLLRTRSIGHQYVIWQTYKKEFSLLSIMSLLQMLHNTWIEIEYRLGISLATNGSHVEVYGT